MMYPRTNYTALSSTLMLAFLAACSSSKVTVPEPDTTAVLSWETCDDIDTLQCATLVVPMDYSNPDGKKIDIALIRQVATGTERKGSLLFNPGGPGDSGVLLIQDLVDSNTVPASIQETYDLVGFDPRGIAGSTPIVCVEDAIADLDSYPLNEADLSQIHADRISFAASCSVEQGEYLQHVGSMNVVRDMEAIRKAVSDDKLNFIGQSYGTRLAALYLQEYPATSGRIVLDASVLPTSSMRDLLGGDLDTRQKFLLDGLSLCVNSDPNCDANELLARLVERTHSLVGQGSMASLDEQKLLAEILSLAIEFANVGVAISPDIIDYINTFDASILERIRQQLVAADFLSEGAEEDEGDETAGIAVSCADDAFRPTIASLVTTLGEFNQRSDLFAESQMVDASMCAGWPTALEPLEPIATSTAPESIVIGGNFDANTPVDWSSKMATAIGGVLISSNHVGHTTVFYGENDCVDGLVAKFLLDGLRPTTLECTQ